MKLWEVEPHMELLSDRASDEAYLAARPGWKYVLYFTKGGSVGLDLSEHPGSFRLRWINIDAGERWRPTVIEGGQVVEVDAGERRRLTMIEGGQVVELNAPAVGPWVAAIVRP